MKSFTYLLCLLPLGACNEKDTPGPQTPASFATPTEARAFFDDLDAQQMRAMVNRDSAFFARHYAPSYYNCTPYGELNDKAAEIQTLLRGPWLTVERMAPQLDIFAYSGNMASLTGTKRIKIRTPAGEQFIYVRRTIVFEKNPDGQWQGISGQGTLVQTRYVGQ
ncbi:MAG: nuclear transport factor 2 family protein [Hymenobacter sp.]|nr:nuclear transport factor 2 family protein [Hymenobacter sp.]